MTLTFHFNNDNSISTCQRWAKKGKETVLKRVMVVAYMYLRHVAELAIQQNACMIRLLCKYDFLYKCLGSK